MISPQNAYELLENKKTSKLVRQLYILSFINSLILSVILVAVLR